MSETVTQKINDSVGLELKVACPNCAGTTYHSVLASVDQSGHDKSDNFDFHWTAQYQVIHCQGCKTVSFRSASSNSEDYDMVGPDEWEYTVKEDLYPSRIAGRKGLGENTVYLSAKIQRLYAETTQALATNCPVLAGVGLRALVESVCEEKDAAGTNLLEKIDDLVIKKILTPTGATILHKIRNLGNSAAHEVKPHSERQLGLAMDVVEHILEDVYILPKQVSAEFSSD